MTFAEFIDKHIDHGGLTKAEPGGYTILHAIELARRIAGNAPATNYALVQVLPRIAEQTTDHGLLTESLMAAIAQSAPEAKARVEAFLQGRADKVRRNG